jgi:hypothetical protein
VAEFKAEVFQNEYLSEGATDVHGVVSVSCSGAGVAGQASGTEAAEIIIVDTSGSMDMPPNKIAAARRAAKVAIDEIVGGADGVPAAPGSGQDDRDHAERCQ